MAAGRIIALAVFFHFLFGMVQSVNQRTLVKRMRTSKRASEWSEMFRAPTMLIFSSPMERKVSYTQIQNFKSVGGTVLPILDAGLVAPYGIAWDAARSALYISDAAQRKIFRVKIVAFKCKRQCKGLEYHLKVHGNHYTVVEGVISQWVAVDRKGNLFFTDQETNSVNKLPVEYIDKIVHDLLLPKDLERTTEPEAEGEESATESTSSLFDSTNATEQAAKPTPPPPSIYQLYENNVNPHVGTPAGVVADSAQLFWTNQVGGFAKGSVCEGKSTPRVKKPAQGDDKPTFPSFKIANNTGSAYGIALTTSKILYTDTSHTVWAASKGTGEVVALTKSMLKPRGIVWDGDNTAYVADEEGNNIVSIPVGLLKENAPASPTVDVHAPFGLAMVRPTDPLWDMFEQWSGAQRSARPVMLLASVAGAILAAWAA